MTDALGLLLAVLVRATAATAHTSVEHAAALAVNWKSPNTPLEPG
ncbi:hypothetical protein ABZY05_44615 [Streptomyces canus]